MACYEYRNGTGDAFGECCEELGVVSKPWWALVATTLPVEVLLVALSQREDGSIGERKTVRELGVFAVVLLYAAAAIVYKLVALALQGDALCSSAWSCYSTGVFMFTNSSVYVVCLTLWLRVECKRYFHWLVVATRAAFLRPFTVVRRDTGSYFDRKMRTEWERSPPLARYALAEGVAENAIIKISEGVSGSASDGQVTYELALSVLKAEGRVGTTKAAEHYFAMALLVLFGGLTHVMPGLFMHLPFVLSVYLATLASHVARVGIYERASVAWTLVLWPVYLVWVPVHAVFVVVASVAIVPIMAMRYCLLIPAWCVWLRLSVRANRRQISALLNGWRFEESKTAYENLASSEWTCDDERKSTAAHAATTTLDAGTSPAAVSAGALYSRTADLRLVILDSDMEEGAIKAPLAELVAALRQVAEKIGALDRATRPSGGSLPNLCEFLSRSGPTFAALDGLIEALEMMRFSSEEELQSVKTSLQELQEAIQKADGSLAALAQAQREEGARERMRQMQQMMERGLVSLGPSRSDGIEDVTRTQVPMVRQAHAYRNFLLGPSRSGGIEDVTRARVSLEKMLLEMRRSLGRRRSGEIGDVVMTGAQIPSLSIRSQSPLSASRSASSLSDDFGEESSGAPSPPRKDLAALRNILRELKKLVFFDSAGNVVVWGAFAILLVCSSASNLGLLIYSGSPYLSAVLLELEARRSNAFVQCLVDQALRLPTLSWPQVPDLLTGLVDVAAILTGAFAILFRMHVLCRAAAAGVLSEAVSKVEIAQRRV